MFCRKCGTEHRKGFTRCADCDVPLVKERPPELPILNTPTNIFRQLDDKIVTFVRSHYLELKEKKDVKFHSIITVLATFIFTSYLSPFFWSDDVQGLKNFFAVYRIVFALFCFALYALVFISGVFISR